MNKTQQDCKASKTSQELFDEADEFTRGYIACALWVSVGIGDPDLWAPVEDGEIGPQGITDEHAPSDIAIETMLEMLADCATFQRGCPYITDEFYIGEAKLRYSVADLAGHDFWLTRNGHGGNFLDGDWKMPAAQQLYKAAQKYNECYLYVGDDGLIYQR